MPGDVKIWTGHDYPPKDRDSAVPWLRVREHRERNSHLKDGVSQEEFVALREARDITLAAPKLLHESLQMNIRAGKLPKTAASGHRMLHLPVNLKESKW